jgi:hypothetical protein
LNTERHSFTEIQKFNQWWLWVILTGLVLLPVYGIYKQVYLGQPWGSNPMSDAGLWIFFLGALAFVAFFKYIELRTEIDVRGIRVRLRPIASKVIRWEDIDRVEPITYGFVGYGLRFSFRYGTVYNIRGNKGLAVYLREGGRFVIGTQREEEMVLLLKSLGKLS